MRSRRISQRRSVSGPSSPRRGARSGRGGPGRWPRPSDRGSAIPGTRGSSLPGIVEAFEAHFPDISSKWVQYAPFSTLFQPRASAHRSQPDQRRHSPWTSTARDPQTNAAVSSLSRVRDPVQLHSTAGQSCPTKSMSDIPWNRRHDSPGNRSRIPSTSLRSSSMRKKKHAIALPVT